MGNTLYLDTRILFLGSLAQHTFDIHIHIQLLPSPSRLAYAGQREHNVSVRITNFGKTQRTWVFPAKLISPIAS